MNADYAVLRHTMQDAAADESAAEKENLTAAGKARLLIVDDMRDNRAILRRRFERRGFHIAEADGGLAALDMIAREDWFPLCFPKIPTAWARSGKENQKSASRTRCKNDADF
jgi:PleD family two-component response regulator